MLAMLLHMRVKPAEGLQTTVRPRVQTGDHSSGGSFSFCPGLGCVYPHREELLLFPLSFLKLDNLISLRP